MAARVDLGAGGELVGELEALVSRAPAPGGPLGLPVTALYRAGRQAEALAAYAPGAALLVDELGVEPGPALRALERQILAAEPADAGEPRGASVASRRATCPPLAAPLVGRDERPRRPRRAARTGTGW